MPQGLNFYKKEKNRARLIYKKIGSVTCPVFNGELIYFNSKGFNHLIRKGRMVRPIKEQIIRFFLIRFVKRVIQKPVNRTIIEFEQRFVIERINKFGNKKSLKKPAKFWTIHQTIGNFLVKVVIIQVAGRRKEFLSVMGEKFE